MEKFQALLQSRKFWALVSSLVAVGFGLYNGAINAEQAANLVIGALSAYSLGVAIEDHGKG